MWGGRGHEDRSVTDKQPGGGGEGRVPLASVNSPPHAAMCKEWVGG